MASFDVLLLPGDGIGPEVMAETKKVIDWLGKQKKGVFNTEDGLVGGSAYDKHKVAVTDACMDKALKADAVLFGAVGGPKWDKVPYDVRPEAALLRLRKDLGLFANLRPAICHAALADASSLKRELVEGLDIMIVRELTGGVYFGEPKEVVTLENGEKRAVDTQMYTTHEIDRIARVAFDLAQKAPQPRALRREAQRHALGRAVERGGDGGSRQGLQGRAAPAHPGGRLRHAAGAQPEAVRRHRHRQSVRRHAVG